MNHEMEFQEFSSQEFISEYYMFIKCIKLITGPFIMKWKISISTWENVILHDVTLIHIRPIFYHNSSYLQLHFCQYNISYLKIFRSVVYIIISLPHRTKADPQRRLRLLIWISIYHKVSWTNNMRFIHCSVCWFSFLWVKVSDVKRWE